MCGVKKKKMKGRKNTQKSGKFLKIIITMQGIEKKIRSRKDDKG